MAPASEPRSAAAAAAAFFLQGRACASDPFIRRGGAGRDADREDEGTTHGTAAGCTLLLRAVSVRRSHSVSLLGLRQLHAVIAVWWPGGQPAKLEIRTCATQSPLSADVLLTHTLYI